GLDDMELILTARSGRHAVKDTLRKLGFSNLVDEQFEEIFEDFIALADKKKEVYHHDLYMIMKDYMAKNELRESNIEAYTNEFLSLIDLQVISNTAFPAASDKVKKGEDIIESSAGGTRTIDMLYYAILSLIEFVIQLIEYKISSVTIGKEVVGKLKITASYKGMTNYSNTSETDVIRASGIAYINGIKKFI